MFSTTVSRTKGRGGSAAAKPVAPTRRTAKIAQTMGGEEAKGGKTKDYIDVEEVERQKVREIELERSKEANGEKQVALYPPSIGVKKSQQSSVYDILSTRFSFMSKEEIEKLSVTECKSISLDPFDPYSINSLYMGKVGRGSSNCLTCSQDEIRCPGHLGRINLAVPLPHPLALELIVYVLQSICANCGRLLLPSAHRDSPSISRLRGISRLREIAKFVTSSNTITCPSNLEIVSDERRSQVRLRQQCERAAAIDAGKSEMIPQFGTSEGAAENYKTISARKSCAVPSKKDLTEAIRLEKASIRGDVADGDKPRFCPSVNPKYSTPPRDSGDWHICSTLSLDGATISKHVSIEHVICLFNSIPAEDLKVMGFLRGAHPKNFIISVLPVIPERNRPHVERDGEIKHDHLTWMYQQIIRKNTFLEKIIKDAASASTVRNASANSESLIDDSTNSLYNYISHLMNNSDGTCTIRNKEPLFSISARLTGKEGLCRANAQGKRVNFCARSVGGGASCPFGAIVIPSVMKILTVPERVHALNFDRVIRDADNGIIIHHTASSGEFEGIRMRFPQMVKNSIDRGLEKPDIRIGDLVERLGKDGDDVFVNRQPTLHKHSVIGVKTIHRPDQKTIKIHMSITGPMNGDFDGDEFNIFLPRTNRARAELRHILGAHKQLVSSKSGGATMGIVFNAPISAYLLSVDANSFPNKQILDIFEWKQLVKNFLLDDKREATLTKRLAKYDIKPLTARAVVSLAFPEDFYYNRKVDKEKDTDVDNSVVIRNGVFVSGLLGKKDLGERFVQSILVKYGDRVAGRFITEMTYLLDWFIERRGFTIGLMDTLLSKPEDARRKVDERIEAAREEITKISSVETYTELEKIHREQEITSVLESVLTVGDELAKEEEGVNPLAQMIQSGAKGGPTNIAQIAGLLGEQFMSGKRPEPTVFGGRTLFYFDQGDQSIEARGFAKHSFAEGLRPSEFIFHMSASRVGLLDTSLKTADVGTIQHKLTKVLENGKLNYLGGVVDSTGHYISPSYGEGYAPEELVRVGGFVSTGEMYMPVDVKLLSEELNFESERHGGGGMLDDDSSDDDSSNDDDAPRNLTIDEVDSILAVIPPVQAALSKIADHNLKQIRKAFGLQLAEIQLAPSKIDSMKSRIYNRCRRAALQPGENVGLSAAEALGQPITQATLNTFHHSGGADVGTSVSGAFSEVLGLTRNRKMYSAKIHLENDSLTLADVKALSRTFSHVGLNTLVKDTVSDIEMITDDRPILERGEFYPLFAEFDMMASLASSEKRAIPFHRLGTVFIRIKLDLYRLYETRITTRDVADAIETAADGVHCVYSPTSLGIVDVYTDTYVITTVTSVEKKVSDKTESLLNRAARGTKKLNVRIAEASMEGLTDVASARKVKANKTGANAKELAFGLKREAESFALDVVLTEKNAARLFFQKNLIPIITNGSVSISPPEANDALARIENKFVPFQAEKLAFYKSVRAVSVDTMEIVRGDKFLGDMTWKIFFDRPKEVANGVPRERVLKLIDMAFSPTPTLVEERKSRLVKFKKASRTQPLTAIKVVDREDDDSITITVVDGGLSVRARKELGHIDRGGKMIDFVGKIVRETRNAYEDSLKNMTAEDIDDEDALEEPVVSRQGRYVYLSATTNTNVSSLKSLTSHPAINKRYTTTNNFHEIAEVNGIEAARAAIFKELAALIAGTGIPVNPRHIQIIVDVMSSSGILMQCTARGTVRQHLGAYSESSFEQAVQAFKRSAVSGSSESVSATSTSILVGAQCVFGTGSFLVESSAPRKPLDVVEGSEVVNTDALVDRVGASAVESTPQASLGKVESSGDPGVVCGGGITLESAVTTSARADASAAVPRRTSAAASVSGGARMDSLSTSALFGDLSKRVDNVVINIPESYKYAAKGLQN